MKTPVFWLRLMGLSGVLGGLLLFAGDMLFYYDATRTDLIRNMAEASDLRIVLSAITALFATWLYVFGSLQMYYAFEFSKPLVKNLILACFAMILIAYGIVHGAYVAIATTAKLGMLHEIPLDEATALASYANRVLRMFIYPVFGLLSFLFFMEVWKRKSHYPGWMLFFFPLIPFMFQGFFTRYLTGGTWIIFVGGFYNLILVVFFAASTIALWNGGKVVKSDAKM